MAQAPARAASVVRLFDAHCHLQDPRLLSVAPSLIRAATAAGVARFAVNGTSERAERLAPGEADGRGVPVRRPLLRPPPMVGTGEIAGLDGFAPAVLR